MIRQIIRFIQPTSPKLLVWSGLVIVGLVGILYSYQALPVPFEVFLAETIFRVQQVTQIVPASFLTPASKTSPQEPLEVLVFAYICTSYIWACLFVTLFGTIKSSIALLLPKRAV